jgi:hypothetical protein
MSNTRNNVKSALFQILWLIVAVLISIGISVYWIKFAITPTQVVSPITVAAVLLGICSYIIMGNLIVGQSRPLLSPERRLIFIYLGLGVIAFFISYFLIQVVSTIKSPTLSFVDWLIAIATAIFMSIAAVASGMAISVILRFLIRNIRIR